MISHKEPRQIEQLIKKQEKLANHCSYAIGGTAEYFASPHCVTELVELLRYCKQQRLEYTLFGIGSNVLFSDRPSTNMMYISLKELLQFDVKDGEWFVSAGMPMSMLALAGELIQSQSFQFTHLLPGSFGAGIYMNAKYYHGQIGDVISRVYYLDAAEPDLEIKCIPVEECKYGYKQSVFQEKPWIILGADIPVEGHRLLSETEIESILEKYMLMKDNKSNLMQFYAFFSGEMKRLTQPDTPAFIQEIEQYRTKNKHFVHHSCGSYFKNNYDIGQSIGALVDHLQLKGTTYGGAMISSHHGNMLINVKDATAEHILQLQTIVSEAIYKEYGFIPEPEVAIIK
ncbi:UDP-N-acetylmuramate dehydrogenase [Paenibacillus fonticola]|uniref:UDP-N-acetylmuramate dehydrogenase n=1 Tax=Paenibacillus fonticola TaxID=379896 RepID=UPI001F0B6AEF|nr:UDP-N-acetylmuramate dehydrogenase [Paenibacillus fonticola]